MKNKSGKYIGKAKRRLIIGVGRRSYSTVSSGRTHALHASSPGSLPGLGEYYSRRKNLALYIRDCESLCLSDDTVKAVGPFYLRIQVITATSPERRQPKRRQLWSKRQQCISQNGDN